MNISRYLNGLSFYSWFFCLLVLSGFAQAFDIKVMSFNIKNGNNVDNGPEGWEFRRQQVFDVFTDYTPDIVGLQEAFRYQLDEMGAALPQFAEIGVGRDDGVTAGEYSAIFYLKDKYTVVATGDFWLSSTPDEPGSVGEGASLPRICTWGRFREIATGNHFYFYNAHYSHVSSAARLEGARVIAERMADRQHQQDSLIYACDCNASETSEPMRYLFGEMNSPVALKSAWRVLYPDESDSRTGHGWSGNRSGNPIDYVLIPRQGVEVFSSVIIYDNINGDYPSDHYPIMSGITLPDQETGSDTLLNYRTSGINGGPPVTTLTLQYDSSFVIVMDSLMSADTITGKLDAEKWAVLTALFPDNDFASQDSNQFSGCLSCPDYSITYGGKRVFGNTPGGNDDMQAIIAGLEECITVLEQSVPIIPADYLRQRDVTETTSGPWYDIRGRVLLPSVYNHLYGVHRPVVQKKNGKVKSRGR